MRSKSRSTFSVVNARDPRQSASAHAIYPQNAGLKLITPRRANCRPPWVLRSDPASSVTAASKSIVRGSSGVTFADKSAMSEENDSVLGNLPRSRPGVRSEKRATSKRAGGAGAAGGSPPAPKAKPSTTARTKAAAKPRPKPAAKARTQPAEQSPPPATPSPATPIATAIKAGETVAVTGLKVAGKLAGEVLRRLPRP
jgi:hypothetical protein